MNDEMDPKDARIAELERKNAELTNMLAVLTAKAAPSHGALEPLRPFIEQVPAAVTMPGDDMHYLAASPEGRCLGDALRDSESFHRQVLESIPGMVFTASADGTCDYVSEQWVEFSGVPAALLLSDGWVQVLHPEDRSRAFSAWRKTVQDLGKYDLEYRVRRQDGVYEWFKVRGCAIRDDTGAVVRWFGVAMNVDDLKRAEAALVARERELRTLADNIPDLLCRLDRQLRVVFANTAVQAATGVRPEDSLGKTNQELGMPTHLCNLWDSTARVVFEQRQPKPVEFAFDGPLGLRYYASRFLPEQGSDGEVEHVLAVTHDVTELKQAQEALEDADRRKDDFLAALAHELRNPLAPLRNGLEVLRLSAPFTERQAKACEMMERQLAHLVRLVDDLLDVARIRRGKLEIKPQPIEVSVVLEHAVETSRPLIEESRHTLTVQIPEESAWINGDLTRLAQVIGNLLNNAAKYTPQGGHIELRAGVQGNEVVVRAIDDGIGIEADMLLRVFDLFTQEDRTRNRAQGGLGIGLSLVHRIVEMHGGTIVAESPGLGRGSTFTMRLPLASTVADTPGGPRPRLDQVRSSPRHRILVVDDNTDAAETLAMLLELTGHETTAVGDGPTALEIARAWAPELMFLDIGLPEMDGYEVARRLRADPANAGLVLVALTGWGSEDDQRKSREAGFDLHLIKPVGPGVVADVLARLPELRRFRRCQTTMSSQRLPDVKPSSP